MTITEKKLAILKSYINTASMITNQLKGMPQTGKKRNVFIKTYNRRPQNKKKRSLVIAKTAFTSAFGAARIEAILSMPVPKYHKLWQSH